MSYSTVMASWTRVVVDGARGYGVDRARLFEGLPIDERVFDDPDARIDATVDTALWSRLEQLIDRPDLSLSLIEHFLRPGTFGLVGFVARASSTLDEALRAAARYHALVCSDGSFRYRPGGRPELIRVPPPHSPWPPVLAEAVLICILRLARAWSRPGLAPVAVRFQHARPRDVRALEDYLGVTPVFGCRDNALVFSEADVATPLRHAEPQLRRYLSTLAESQLEGLLSSQRFEDRVRTCIAELMAAGNLTLDAVADSLSVTPRTLQRRLRERGVTYHELCDAVRIEHARRLLESSSLNIADIARRLGFSESGAFRRAFRRWTGQSPRRFRLELQQGS